METFHWKWAFSSFIKMLWLSLNIYLTTLPLLSFHREWSRSDLQQEQVRPDRNRLSARRIRYLWHCERYCRLVHFFSKVFFFSSFLGCLPLIFATLAKPCVLLQWLSWRSRYSSANQCSRPAWAPSTSSSTKASSRLLAGGELWSCLIEETSFHFFRPVYWTVFSLTT